MFSSTGGMGSFGHPASRWSRNSSLSTHSSGFSQASYNGNSTFGVINELKFLATKSSRQSTVILAAFNVVSAAATAAGILYTSYLAAKRLPPKRGERINIFTCIRSPDVYPFFISMGIVAQGIIFAVSQAQGLHSLFRQGCDLISQFMWPAIFIVPYIQLVFAVETALRALKSHPFPPRGKWTVAICMTIVKTALLATGLATFFIRAPNVCFASLFWFVAKWADGGVALLLVIVVVLAVCAGIIYIKLMRPSMVEDDERVGASRMVYYIALAIIPNALMIPFFVYLSFGNSLENGGDTGLTLSMVATVVANVTGLLTGGLYLFLRSNTGSTIAPKTKMDEYERQQITYQNRISKDTDSNSHIMKPILTSQWPRESESTEKRSGEEENRLPGYIIGIPSVDYSNPLGPNAVLKQTTLVTPVRKVSSYALFPNKNQRNTASKALLPSTAYSPDSNSSLPTGYSELLQPPPSIQPLPLRHRRDSSMVSSATVQIGLRLSNVGDVTPATANPVDGVEQTHELGCPKRLNVGISGRPRPLIPPRSVTTSPSPKRALRESQIDITTKLLPPIPPNSRVEAEKAPVLNPTVYSPKSSTNRTVPGAKGDGFNALTRTNTTTTKATEMSRHTSRARAISAADSASRADWI
ncbi:hypothetical protein F5Y14DRAFT_54522 [Nemania sp. NC0429]|nr:hypothetical protein F5Y14DRAFT_54522 [Nemania sp. NC0429]